MRGQRRFTVSIPHVGLVIILNEYPQEFYQAGFWHSKFRPDTTVPGVDFFRFNDRSAYTVRCFSVMGIRFIRVGIKNKV